MSDDQTAGKVNLSAIRSESSRQLADRATLRRVESQRGTYHPKVGDIAISIPGIFAGKFTTGVECLIVEVREEPLVNATWVAGVNNPLFKEFDVVVSVLDQDGEVMYFDLDSECLQLVERPID